MKDGSRGIAKLTAPSGGELLKRERLFAVLDAARAGKVAWIMAPGGAGKTSLAATWAQARRLPCIWYSLDPGDADPGSFFYYFATAAQQRFGVTDLPLYGEGHRTAVGVFARRFFERLFAAIDPSLIVVLDSYQELPADAPVHDAVDALFASVPQGALVVAASRTTPPPRLARWMAAADLRFIDWNALRLTREETAALAAAHGVTESGWLDTLVELARGWAAGVVLIARALAHGLKLPRPGDSQSNTVFDYFAMEVFAKAPPETQAFVLRTAFLPSMTAAAAAGVSGEPRAAELLEELHRGQLFIERKDGDEPLYGYHPLFRDFLQAQARAAFDAKTLRSIRLASAAALEARGDAEAAAPLLAVEGEWPALARLVREHARRLAAHGRCAVIAGWLAAVPEPVLREQPWLLFWSGWCRMIDHQPGWRAPFEAAFERFASAGDIEGAFTSCAWLLRTSLTAEDAEAWIATAERLAAAHPAFPDPAAEARVIACFGLVHQFPPHHPLLERWVARAEVLARTLDDIGARMRMAAFALGVHLAQGDLRRMGVVVAETRALAAREDAPPSDKLVFLLFCGYYRLQHGDLEEAAAIRARIDQLAAGTGSLHDRAIAWHYGERIALCADDLAAARECHARLIELGDYLPPHAQHGRTRTVYLRLLERDAESAVAAARAVLEVAAAFPALRPMWRANLAQALLEQGDAKAAHAELDEAVASARAARLPSTECTALLLRAAALFDLGDNETAWADLSEGLTRARELGCVPQLPFILRPTLARLAARALERRIERDFVADLVARWRLAPPSPEEERWPWTVRVRTLGAFEIAVDGEALNGSIKAQRKPLELLKCVIAFGARDVSAAAVMQALWPDAEGDAAKRSFDITLHRLRRALARDDAIVLEGGKLAFNPGVVWLDSAAFERLAVRIDETLRGVRPSASPVRELLDRALRLYRGAFLASDDDAWAQPTRAKLRNRYLQLVERGGEFLERSQHSDAALVCYQRAVELDPPAERIYQRIMRSLHAQGRCAEALDVYARCREMLAATLGTQPSAETEALHELLRSG
jgi:LuxR family maltose regulon positive regulatory protein